MSRDNTLATSIGSRKLILSRGISTRHNNLDMHNTSNISTRGDSKLGGKKRFNASNMMIMSSTSNLKKTSGHIKKSSTLS